MKEKTETFHGIDFNVDTDSQPYTRQHYKLEDLGIWSRNEWTHVREAPS